MKLTALIALVGAVAAQNATSSSNATDAMIPTGVSATCSQFMQSLDSAETMQSCLSPFLKALTTNSTGSLSSICTSSQCGDTTVRSWLTSFSGNCSAELTGASPNQAVVDLYGALYVLKPFSSAVCSKVNGTYCLSAPTSAQSQEIQNAAQAPLATANGMPNANSFSSGSLSFLGANTHMSKEDLCTDCYKAVISSYIAWENSFPSATGVDNIALLKDQSSLWTYMQSTCPADFISGALNNAGAAPDASLNGASSVQAKGAAALLMAVAAAAIAL